jgi:hypothetical protein
VCQQRKQGKERKEKKKNDKVENEWGTPEIR